jgi:hypothetical protein
MPALDSDLKKAIVHLPGVEKDKLLLRLIAKDATLSEKLYFELVERGQTIDERRELIRISFAGRLPSTPIRPAG